MQSKLPPEKVENNSTFCNVLDLNYRYMLNHPELREAADPVVVLYKGDYYLFASKSGGYWYSSDFQHWTLVKIGPENKWIESFAPAILIIGDVIYYIACPAPQDRPQIFKSTNPKAGEWEVCGDAVAWNDPALFQDDDGRIYLYGGCSPADPIVGIELDENLQPKGKQFECLKGQPDMHGWEQPRPEGGPAGNDVWIEGAWMTKHNGVYYLQYAGPATEVPQYADGCYISDTPVGPFTYAPYSPVCHMPTGFAAGAGHGCTFEDRSGNFWRAITVPLGSGRRVSVYPADFDKDGVLHCNTVLADYPMYLPDKVANPIAGAFVGWMLLSYNKQAKASSTLEPYSIEHAFDENNRTHWSAKTGDAGEWLSVDLGKICRINAIQINFDEQDSYGEGRTKNYRHRFVLETSDKGEGWSILIDRSSTNEDTPHFYIQLDEPVMARYLRITNVEFPAGGKFSITGFRVFGSGLQAPPAQADDFSVERSKEDQRVVNISWKPVDNADGYIVRYGIAPDKLYNNFQVYGESSILIDALNVGVDYYFTVDSFNDSGLTMGTDTKHTPAC